MMKTVMMMVGDNGDDDDGGDDGGQCPRHLLGAAKRNQRGLGLGI